MAFEVGIAGVPDGLNNLELKPLVPALDSHFPLTVKRMSLPQFNSRYFDAPPPYYGGALMQNHATGDACSTGFGVAGINGAATYLITAAHCGEGTWRSGVVVPPSGIPTFQTFGNTIPELRNTDLDVELIYTPQGADRYVYWGRSINPPSDFGAAEAVRVSDAAANVTEQTICVSGALSGTQCTARIIALNITLTIEPPTNGVERVTNLVWAEYAHPVKEAVVGKGDSGGPVTGLAANGTVTAHGIMSAQLGGPYLRPCKGFVHPDRQCSYSFFYADLRNAMVGFGVKINR